MIPIRLKIQGLYSYQGPQEIDFGPLLDAGLFGIFGGVGSGKSTILEAMTFALYAQTDRLSQRGDDRLYNMMNLQSTDFLIDFECYAGPQSQKYRFVVKAQRNRKRFMDVPKMERVTYQWFDEAWRPMQETSTGEQIIGLSYDNFRRTIIIPQGRFQDFIELKGQERTEMMKEIFQLEKFDLSAAAGKLLRDTKQKLDVLAGQLVGLEEVHPDRLEALMLEEKLQRDQLAGLTQSYQELQVVHDTLTALAAWKAQEEALLTREQVLQDQAPAMHTLQQQLADYDHVQTHYQTAKVQYDAGLLRWQEWTAKQHAAQVEVERAQEKWGILQQQRVDWQERLVRLDQWRADLVRWQMEEKLLALHENVQRLSVQKEVLATEYQEKLLEEKQYIDQKLQLTQQWESWQPRIRSDFHEVSTQMRQWYQTKRMLQQQKVDLKLDADRVKKQEALVLQRIAEVQAELAQFGPDVEAIYMRERQKWEEAATQWHIQHSWSHLVNHLVDGSPCPVCGSSDHPAPAQVGLNSALSLDDIQAKQKALESRYQLYKQQEKQVEIHQSGLTPLVEQRAEIIRRWELNKQQMQAHEALFPGEEPTWREEASFLAWEKEQKDMRGQQEQALAALRQLEQRLEAWQVGKRALEERLLTCEKQVHAQQVLWQAQRDQLSLDPESSSVLDAQSRQVAIQQAIEKEEQASSLFEQEYQRAQEIVQASTQSLQQWQELVAKEADALASARARLEERCRLDPRVETWAQLTVLLTLFNAQTLPKAREKWAEYVQERTKWEDAKAHWEVQGKQFEGITYDADQHALAQQALGDLQKQLDEGKNHLGALLQQRIDTERKLQEKTNLLTEQGQLNQRKSELDTLDRLFRGQGFVNFVSRIFLEQLCAVANQRFERMTRGQLQLKIGPENTFWVIDRLHGGKERLLKTLSGGQKFQASLALALALADGIQQKLRLEQHFFFIDEGFGSLDKESLQVVFETLTSLRQEKRCVGVISHVEELQQEIQTYLLIKRLDSGSQITKSWEI